MSPGFLVTATFTGNSTFNLPDGPVDWGYTAFEGPLGTPAASGPLQGILAVTNDPLVSIDFNHIAASSTAALAQTQVIEGQLGRVLSWYDNEWGFSTRMSDTAVAMAKLI